MVDYKIRHRAIKLCSVTACCYFGKSFHFPPPPVSSPVLYDILNTWTVDFSRPEAHTHSNLHSRVFISLGPSPDCSSLQSTTAIPPWPYVHATLNEKPHKRVYSELLSWPEQVDYLTFRNSLLAVLGTCAFLGQDFCICIFIKTLSGLMPPFVMVQLYETGD